MARVLNEKLAELREIEDNKDSDIRELEIMEDKKLYKILSRYEKDMKGLTEIFDEIHNGKSIHEIIREG